MLRGKTVSDSHQTEDEKVELSSCTFVWKGGVFKNGVFQPSSRFPDSGKLLPLCYTWFSNTLSSHLTLVFKIFTHTPMHTHTHTHTDSQGLYVHACTHTHSYILVARKQKPTKQTSSMRNEARRKKINILQPDMCMLLYLYVIMH